MAGASGYVLKDIGIKELMKAVDTVSKGQSLLDPAVTSKIIDKMRKMSIKSTIEADEQLTARKKRFWL